MRDKKAADTKAKKPENRPGGAGEKESRMRAMAQALFSPKDKNPYWFHGKPLSNMKELVDNLANFAGNEGDWVASWLGYLGDKEIADRIRKKPGEFKEIVDERYRELKKYSPA